MDVVHMRDEGDRIIVECSCGWRKVRTPDDVMHGLSLFQVAELAARSHLVNDHMQPPDFIGVAETTNFGGPRTALVVPKERR